MGAVDVYRSYIICFADAVAVQGSDTTDGPGQIWLDSVTCTGTETRLTDCHISGFGGHNCSHSQDVGVICQGERISSCLNKETQMILVS